MSGVGINAKIVVYDEKEKEYDLTKVDTMFKGEIIFNIKSSKSSYKN